MPTTWTFTLRSGVGPLQDAAVYVRGDRFDVDAQLAAGGGQIVTSDPDLYVELVNLRAGGLPLLDVNGVTTPGPADQPARYPVVVAPSEAPVGETRALKRNADGTWTLVSAGSSDATKVARQARGRLSVTARPEQQIPVFYMHGENPTNLFKEGLRQGFVWITVAELADGLAGRSLLPAKPALAIFDDCHFLQYDMVFPIAQQLGAKITLGCVPNWLDGLPVNSALSTYQPNPSYPANQPMTWAQLNEMLAAGHDVQNHSLKHNQITADTQAERLADYAAANARIATMTGKTPRAFILPQGAFNAAALADLKTLGFEMVFRSAVGSMAAPMLAGGSQFAIPRAAVNPANASGHLHSTFAEIIYHYERDINGIGTNAANALGYWATAPTYQSNGETIEVTGANQYLVPTDYFRVKPGSQIYFNFDAYTTGQTAGSAAIELQEYTGPPSAKVAGTLNTLKNFAATTASTNYEGVVTLGASTTFVRFYPHTLASFNGTLGMSRAVCRIA